MTLADPITARAVPGFGWLSRLMPRRRTPGPRFEPIADLPPYLLYDIGLTPERRDRDRRW